MLTKAVKQEHVKQTAQSISKSQAVVFVDFTGVPTKEINQLKADLRKSGSVLKVVKKSLLNIALKEAGINFDPTISKAPIATVYATGEMTTIAAPIYKFSKELAKKKMDFKVLGAFDKISNAVLSAAEFTVIAKLPSREVLLAQVLGGMTGPLRAFMYILDQLSKKAPVAASAPKPAEAAAPTPTEAPAEAKAVADEPKPEAANQVEPKV